MSGLFKGRTEDRTTTVDPWESMPPWLKKQLKSEGGFRGDMLGDSKDIADRMGQDPRQIAEMTDEEREAYGLVEGAIDEQGRLGGKAADMLDGSTVPEGYGDYANTYTGDRMSGLLEGRDFESEYTGEVVDTTLAGMDRNTAREALARESRNAATGGTSNSRSAVGQAVADQLSGMNRSQVEAKLRDDAFRFGVGKDFEAAGMLDGSDQFKSGMDLDVDKLTGQSQEYLMGRDMDMSSAYDRLASTGQVRSMAGADWMKGFGSEQRGLEQAQLDADRNAEAESMSWLSSIFSGAQGTQAPIGSTTTGQVEKPSLFSQLLGGASAVGGIAGMISDERAKENIVPMGSGLDALRDVVPSTYNYRDDSPAPNTGRTSGLMAQDLEHIPGAVVTRPDGYLMVEPYAVVSTIVKAVQELDKRTAGLTHV